MGSARASQNRIPELVGGGDCLLSLVVGFFKCSCTKIYVFFLHFCSRLSVSSEAVCENFTVEHHSYDHSFCGCRFLLVLFLLGSRREYTWGHFPNGCHSLCCVALKCLNTVQHVRGLDSCAGSHRQCASALWCALVPQQAEHLIFVTQKSEKWIEYKREWPYLGWRGGGSLAWSRYVVSSCNMEFCAFWGTLIVLPAVQIEWLILTSCRKLVLVLLLIGAWPWNIQSECAVTRCWSLWLSSRLSFGDPSLPVCLCQSLPVLCCSSRRAAPLCYRLHVVFAFLLNLAHHSTYALSWISYTSTSGSKHV